MKKSILVIVVLSVLSITSLIAQPKLSSPNGGETIAGGSVHKIQWTQCAACVSANDMIEFSTNNGGTWTVITPSVSDAIQYYNWTVPMVASTQCLVRISNNGNSDVSNAVFTITAPAGIEAAEESAAAVLFYPNPASSELNISNIDADTKIESVQLYNFIGEVVKSENVVIEMTKTGRINVSDIASGAYFLGFNNASPSKKVMIVH